MPQCGASYIAKRKSGVAVRERLVPGTSAARAEHFAGRGAMNIEGSGIADQAADRERTGRDYADVYHLSAEQIANLPAVGPR